MKSEYSALVKEKLVGPGFRAAELDRLSVVLDDGEEVVTLADALFRTGSTERRGLAVLTDRRLLCVEKDARLPEQLEFPLSEITSLESRVSGGMGDARRGELSFLAGGVPCDLVRIQPCERGAEIAANIRAGAALRAAALAA